MERRIEQVTGFYKETIRRIAELPGVDGVAMGIDVPWRDAGNFGPGSNSRPTAMSTPPGEEDPRARFRIVSPGFFATLGVPILAGRDFNDADRAKAASRW